MNEVFGPTGYALVNFGISSSMTAPSFYRITHSPKATSWRVGQNRGHWTAQHGIWRARGPKAAHIALLFPDSLEDAGPDPKAKPEKKQKNINKTVEKLLKKYPPQVKK